MGSVYKRNAVWWIKYYKNGRPIRESSKSIDYYYAKRLLNAKQGAVAEGRHPSLNASHTLVKDLADLYLMYYEENRFKSIERAKEFAALIKKHLGHLRATELTTDQLRKYRQARKADSVEDSTINRELSALRRMFRLGVAEDPPRVFRVPKIPFVSEKNSVRTGFFEYKDFEAIRSKAAPHLKVALTIAYHTGMRVGEILKLRWDQIDPQMTVLRLETGTTKSGEGREVPLIKDLKDTLEWWKLETQAKYHWCQWIVHWRGQQIKKIRVAWKKAFKKAKCSDHIFHDLRRTGVRNLVRAGVPERVAMTISGHKTRSVFDRYNIVSHKDIIAAGEKLDRYLSEVKKAKTGTNPGTDDNPTH